MKQAAGFHRLALRLAPLFVLLVILTSVLPSAQTTARAANNDPVALQTEPSADTPVLIVEDRTATSGCRLLVQEAEVAQKQSDEEHMRLLWDAPLCPAGSVFESRRSTYAEVKKSGIMDYVVLTGDLAKDELAVKDLRERVHERLAPEVGSLSSCTAASRIASSGYDAGGRFVLTRFFYTVASDCTMSNMSDDSEIAGDVGLRCWILSSYDFSDNYRQSIFGTIRTPQYVINPSPSRVPVLGKSYHHGTNAAPEGSCGTQRSIDIAWYIYLDITQ